MEKCDRCHEDGADRRNLYMACGYEMAEFKIPFAQVNFPPDKRTFYNLYVCKECRSDWLMAIEHWFNNKPKYVEYREKLRWKPFENDSSETTSKEIK